MIRLPRNWRLRLLAIVALLGHLAGAIGLPVPARALPPVEAVEEGEEAKEPEKVPPTRVRRCGCPVDERAQCCCCSSRSGCCSKTAKPAPPGDTGGLVWVAGVWTAQCQGEQAGLLRVTVPAVLLAPQSRTSQPAPRAWLLNFDESAERLTLPFPEPPPRPFAA